MDSSAQAFIYHGLTIPLLINAHSGQLLKCYLVHPPSPSSSCSVGSLSDRSSHPQLALAWAWGQNLLIPVGGAPRPPEITLARDTAEVADYGGVRSGSDWRLCDCGGHQGI